MNYSIPVEALNALDGINQAIRTQKEALEVDPEQYQKVLESRKEFIRNSPMFDDVTREVMLDDLDKEQTAILEQRIGELAIEAEEIKKNLDATPYETNKPRKVIL